DPGLEAVEATGGSLLTLDGAPVGAENAFEAGRVKVKLTRATGVSGSGVVLVLRVRGLRAGTATVALESLSLTTASGVERPAMAKAKPVLVLLALGQLTCNQAIMTAPAGSSLTVAANPELIPANGGVSIITALVIEPAGTVVADGTVVQFFTNLGDVEEQGKTNDGVARVNFRATGRSGVATITAISGGEAAPAPSPSATATPATGGVPVIAAASTLAGASNASTNVTIGVAGAASVLASADPPQITNARGSSLIRATVFDASG